MPKPEAASRKAMSLAEKYGGAVAFQRSGEPDVGEFKDAVILGKFGKTPDDLSELKRFIPGPRCYALFGRRTQPLPVSGLLRWPNTTGGVFTR